MLASGGILALFLVLLAVTLHWYRITHVNKRPLRGDVFTYLRMAREIRRRRSLPKYLDFYYSGDPRGERLTIPPLLMVLLAPFSHFEYRKLVQIAFHIDLVIALIVFQTSYSLAGGHFIPALVASLVFLLTPSIAVTSASLTPRSLGLLFFLLFLILASCYVTSGNLICFCLGSLAVACMVLSQRMVTQIVVITSPVIVVCVWYFYRWNVSSLLLCVIVGMLLATLATGGLYWTILTDHVRRIILHSRYGDDMGRKCGFSHPLRLLKANPWVLFLAPAVLLQGEPGPSFIIFSGYSLGIIALAQLWYFGDGFSHMFFSAPLVAVLVCGELLVHPSAQMALAACGLFCFVIIMREYSALVDNKRIKSEWFSMFEFINKEKLEGRIFVLPNIACPELIYYTSLTIVSAGHGSNAMAFNKGEGKTLIKDLERTADFIHGNNIDYLLVETQKVPLDDLLTRLVKRASAARPIFEEGDLVLVKIG